MAQEIDIQKILQEIREREVQSKAEAEERKRTGKLAFHERPHFRAAVARMERKLGKRGVRLRTMT